MTEQVRAAVLDSGVQNGVVGGSTAHTTAGVTINEAEPLLLERHERLLSGTPPLRTSTSTTT